MENSASPDLEKSVISNNQPDFPPPIQVREPVKQAATGTSKGKLVFAVPNINKQIMRPNDSIKVHCSKNDWNSILAEDEAHNKKLHRSVPKYPWMKNGQTERPKRTERNNNICMNFFNNCSDSVIKFLKHKISEFEKNLGTVIFLTKLQIRV